MANREQHTSREAKKPKKGKEKAHHEAVTPMGLIDKARGEERRRAKG